jgi:hypothetical protein
VVGGITLGVNRVPAGEFNEPQFAGERRQRPGLHTAEDVGPGQDVPGLRRGCVEHGKSRAAARPVITCPCHR